MAKGKRRRTKELYDKILEAFRAIGHNYSKVGRAAGVDRLTVARVYEYGWPSVEGALPLKQQAEMDHLIVRATRQMTGEAEQSEVASKILSRSPVISAALKRAQEIEEKARKTLEEASARLAEIDTLALAKLEDAEARARARMGLAEVEAKQKLADLLQRAKVDAAETLADEANAAKFGRKAALGATAIAALVLKDAQVIAQQIRTAMGDLSKLSPNQAIRVVREMVRLVESAEKALILALQAERLRVGQPTEVIGIQSLDGSLEEKEIKATALMRSIEKAKARKLSIVQGGATGAVEATAAAGATSAGAPR